MEKIPVYYAFARSGGTLLNRCLGGISGNIVLSEINPYLSVLDIDRQAIDWFDLVSKADYESFLGKNYVEKILYLNHCAQATHRRLIIRDWVSVNFLSNVAIGAFPSKVLEQDLYLKQGGVNPIGIVFSRRAETVLASIKRTFQQFSEISTDDFASAYLSYAAAVSKFPIFHYEDFCENPSSVLQRICSKLDAFYDPIFVDKFHTYHQCTGDNNPGQEPSKYHLGMIAVSGQVESELIEYSKNEKIQEANLLLGYE
ncbi:hypothetical protein [Leptothoe kymatousa]|uniref:Sulfotransferase family protein n=1 Tax=Leptothoe kymatousa TAU-MAC 1615 TaxID=2364775 RepID=A0ABS5Y588_9CYAN|nr:hypothetical protein [Leptothoe kymatousa]MBT9313005.1 sulfotransferase family protein [Leptothoe kymatousa TAU-MAC 1615]